MADRPYSSVSGADSSLLVASHTPLPDNDTASFRRDVALTNTFLASDVSTTPRSHSPSTPSNHSPLLLPGEKQDLTSFAENRSVLPPTTHQPKRRRPFVLLAIGLAALVVVILAVIIPVYFTVIKPKTRTVVSTGDHSGTSATTSSQSANSPQETAGNTPTTVAITGGDGSIITTDDGSQFTYSNKFGGFWVSDPNDPFNNGAQPNSWTPPLNQSWTYGKDRIWGVNIGGLFVLEPFIAPALFQKYPAANDEWSLSTLMAADTASGGLNQLEDHYKTFITEQDIAEIAGAGLNWIRLPIPFWAIETWPGEPFLAKTSWKYILRLLGWCRKYGIRVKIDLHTIPGSQNGYNHSGKLGQVNWMNGVMGYANAQRSLNYIRIITEYFSQPQYKDVVLIFGIVNEALLSTIGRDQLRSFYLEAYSMMRTITGIGQGNGPFMSFHDGFQSLESWSDFLTGGDRVALDTHPYFAFGGGPATDPIATGTGVNAGGVWPAKACNSWGGNVNTSRSTFGVTIAGEYSNGINDCGLFLKGVPGAHTYGGDCSFWQDASQWNSSVKAGLLQFTLASMDALQDSFYWTWKVGNSTAGLVESPLWSYQLGLQQGWIPADPRMSLGTCAALGASGTQFDGSFEAWQTGGAGAGVFQPSATAPYAWPPAEISGAAGPVTLLPSYTSTGSIATLPPPTPTASSTKSIDAGNGWFNTADTAPAPTTIAGCTYPDAYDAIDAAVPAVCT